MHIDYCCEENSAETVLEIFNDAILNTTSIYEYQARTPEQIADWFRNKAAGGWPVLGAFDEEGNLTGFASYGSFRPYPANLYTVEHSVYVHPAHRGKGIARTLLCRLIEEARAQELHVMIGAIDADNGASIRLHESLGFTHAGTIVQAAFKFERWLDLALYQLLLETPIQPDAG
ncbi:GNAT family N-acetyltransferase [Marinobacterium sediminicola]|uniref:Phosphinothricin acetyltransferase n=1 Tax=Marinobacterium sediminicola TaxID=518898 RepID=A0ABY1S0D2_9GAMM|nr:GNAT family N-acetyltransferase [Marinobacterium sediminicola]ULG70062.1 N-acetyltransferase family protein [Marinobacterium sediminicola]SMR74518.1 phosphinothricin acetyltransferase [Marinobacterium sediminicola]